MTGVRLEPGDEAPDFTLPDADGNLVSLSSLRGQQVVVYFYPAAMTPGCTKEACDFTASLPDFSKAGMTVLGISPDTPAKLQKFRDKEHLAFPLLSDPDRAVHEAYGAYGEKMNYGKKTMGVIRSTFVVGADGKIENAYYGVKATGHVDRPARNSASRRGRVSSGQARPRGRGEMAYAAGLGPVGGNTVGVQIPPPARNDTVSRRPASAP